MTDSKTDKLRGAISAVASPNSQILLNSKVINQLRKLRMVSSHETRWYISFENFILMNEKRINRLSTHQLLKLNSTILKGIVAYNNYLDNI